MCENSWSIEVFYSSDYTDDPTSITLNRSTMWRAVNDEQIK